MKIAISDHFNLQKLLRYCLSPVLMMVFSSMYSVVDGLMVSNAVGKNAMASVNIVWPMIMIIGSIGFMIGSGGSAQISKTFGQGDKRKANEIFTFLTLSIVVAGVFFSVLAILNLKDLCYLFGSSDLLYEDCYQYGIILLSFTTFFMLHCAFQNFSSAAGKPFVGFIATVASGIVNVVLDYLFIVVLNKGVAGAALATGLGYFTGSFIPFVYFLLPNKSTLRFCKTKLYFHDLFCSCYNGISEMLTNVSSSFVAALFNRTIITLIGEDGVSAYSIIAYMDYFFKAILLGIAIASAPIIAYNYGAERKDELKNVYKMTIKLVVIVSIVMFAISQLSSNMVARLFVSDDLTLQMITDNAMKLYSIGYLFCGINIFASSFFTALCNGKLSAIVSSIRSFVVPVVSIGILAKLLGINGVWLTIPLSEIICFMTSIYFIIRNGKKYGYN